MNEPHARSARCLPNGRVSGLMRPGGTDVRAAICFTMCVVVTGCMMGPDYKRPPIDAPTAFQYEQKAAAETANVEWWKQFGDPVLEQLITEALANNKDVKIAAANVEQAFGVLTSTRSPLFPQVNYQGSAGRYRLSTDGTTSVRAGRSISGAAFADRRNRRRRACLPRTKRDAASS